MKRSKLLRGINFSGLAASLSSIVVGLLVGFIVLAVCNPSQAANGIRTLLLGGVTGGTKGLGNVLYYAMPILMTGLGVSLAFQANMFNLGGPGQFVVGSFCALFMAIRFDFPGFFGWLIPLISGALGGALWALLPGILRAYLKVNVVIATIMMNYMGMYLVNYLVKQTIYDPLKGQSQIIPSGNTLPYAGMDRLFPNSMANIGILIAVLLAVLLYILMNRTVLGFELRSCGKNSDASRYAGINEKRNIILSMGISGAMIGLGGALLYLSPAGKYLKVVDVLAAEGFNGIPVALLAMNHPIGVIFTSIFIAYLQVSGFYMQTYQFAPEIVDIIIAVIIYFSAFSLILKNIFEKLKLRRENRQTSNGKGLEAL